MPGAIYPYTVTNSYKGGLFMRTYNRNVRRAWDGEDYRPPKRQRLDHLFNAPSMPFSSFGENAATDFDLEDNLERAIRETSVAALSSSPSRKNSTVFSAESRDDDTESNTVTPPSSPPPTLHLTPPMVKARKPTFSFMDKSKKEKKEKAAAKRKADALCVGPNNNNITDTRYGSEPLSEILNSSSRMQSQPLPSTTPPAILLAPHTAAPRPTPQFPKLGLPKQTLVQTKLDLGQPLLPTTCLQCQMSYTPSLQEDVQLHNMYHNRDSSGIELGKGFLKSAMKWCYQVPNIPGSVVVVDRKIAVPGRRAVQSALEIVNKELGSVEIKEEDLWSQRDPDGETKEEPALNRKCDRYKVFLHIVDEKCVGVCLAERISKAHRVLPNHSATSEVIPLNGHVRATPPVTAADEANGAKDFDTAPAQRRPEIPTPIASPTTSSPSSSISVSEDTMPAVVGVSRIWTSRAFRHKGIASNLLDCVVNQFIYGMEIDRSEVAFSQPTESGAALARSWFGENDGWAVYRED